MLHRQLKNFTLPSLEKLWKNMLVTQNIWLRSRDCWFAVC